MIASEKVVLLKPIFKTAHSEDFRQVNIMSHSAIFGQVKIDGHFADFRQVKN